MRPQGVFSVRAAARQTPPRKLLVGGANRGGLQGADTKPSLYVRPFGSSHVELPQEPQPKRDAFANPWVTQIGQRWTYRRTAEDKLRLEQREAIASVLDAAHALDPSMRRNGRSELEDFNEAFNSFSIAYNRAILIVEDRRVYVHVVSLKAHSLRLRVDSVKAVQARRESEDNSEMATRVLHEHFHEMSEELFELERAAREAYSAAQPVKQVRMARVPWRSRPRNESG